MNLVFQTEIERVRLADNFQEEINWRGLQEYVEKFEYIFELTAGKGRE